MIRYQIETQNDTLTGDGTFNDAVFTLARCFAAGPSAFAVAYVDGLYSFEESSRVEEAAMDLYMSR
jgi:hypothetical protein